MDYSKRYSSEAEIYGKKAKLIGFWIDLAAYYDDGENAWKYQSGSFVNMGETKEFVQDLKNGKYRGKLI